MRRLILHIGPPQGGAGAIAAGLSLNREALARAGRFVHAPGPAARAGTAAPPAATAAGEVSAAFAALRAEAARAGLDAAIVSREDWWSLPADGIRALRRETGSAAVSVVACLAPQDRWLQERWPELVKYGWEPGQEPQAFASWVAGLLDAPPASPAGVVRDGDYLGVLDAWAAVFGRTAPRVAVLEEGWGPRELFARFLSLCEVPDAGGCQPPPGALLAPGPRTLAVLRHLMPELRRRYPAQRDGGRSLADALPRAISRHASEHGWDPAPAHFLDRALHERILGRFDAGNRALAKKYLGRDELFARPYAERPPTPCSLEGFSGESVLALMAALLPEVAARVEADPDLACHRRRGWSTGRAVVDPDRVSLPRRIAARCLRTLRSSWNR